MNSSESKQVGVRRTMRSLLAFLKLKIGHACSLRWFYLEDPHPQHCWVIQGAARQRFWNGQLPLCSPWKAAHRLVPFSPSPNPAPPPGLSWICSDNRQNQETAQRLTSQHGGPSHLPQTLNSSYLSFWYDTDSTHYCSFFGPSPLQRSFHTHPFACSSKLHVM